MADPTTFAYSVLKAIQGRIDLTQDSILHGSPKDMEAYRQYVQQHVAGGGDLSSLVSPYGGEGMGQSWRTDDPAAAKDGGSMTWNWNPVGEDLDDDDPNEFWNTENAPMYIGGGVAGAGVLTRHAYAAAMKRKALLNQKDAEGRPCTSVSQPTPREFPKTLGTRGQARALGI